MELNTPSNRPISEYKSNRLSDRIVYQAHEGKVLHLDAFRDTRETHLMPAILFFHGGGWSAGDTRQFHPFSDFFAERGWMAFCAQYRLINEAITPFDCVADAGTALNWLADHAGDLRIRKDAIVVAGASAGGHLAVCAS